jgi:hypothetical protein
MRLKIAVSVVRTRPRAPFKKTSNKINGLRPKSVPLFQIRKKWDTFVPVLAFLRILLGFLASLTDVDLAMAAFQWLQSTMRTSSKGGK